MDLLLSLCIETLIIPSPSSNDCSSSLPENAALTATFFLLVAKGLWTCFKRSTTRVFAGLASVLILAASSSSLNGVISLGFSSETWLWGYEFGAGATL